MQRTDFSGALYCLLASIGQRVEVSIGSDDGEPPMTATFAGVLANGDDLSYGEATAATEAFLFTFSDQPGAAVFLPRRTFGGAELDDYGILTLWPGPLVVIVEQRDEEPDEDDAP